MSFDRVTGALVGDTPGRSTELTYFRIGPAEAGKKVYLQAALHADEQPGILVLHHLLQMLRDADAAGALKARFVLFPMVNPLGMGDIEFGRHQGRYNRASGVNHNRGWPTLYDVIGEDAGARLGDDAAANVALIRDMLREGVARMPEITAFEQWRKLLIGEACDADYVFDVHCDDDSLVHIFSVPQNEAAMRRLAARLGAAATLLAEDSGGASFDEIWPAIWLRLQREQPDKPLPLPVAACTIEFRGQCDTFDELNRADAASLYAYFQDEGLIDGAPPAPAGEAAEPTDLRATEYLRAPDSGLLIYRAELGARLKKGDPVADLLRLDGDGAFVERVPLAAGTDGILLSRSCLKYVWRKANVGKIVGSEILAGAGDFLLSD